MLESTADVTTMYICEGIDRLSTDSTPSGRVGRLPCLPLSGNQNASLLGVSNCLLPQGYAEPTGRERWWCYHIYVKPDCFHHSYATHACRRWAFYCTWPRKLVPDGCDLGGQQDEMRRVQLQHFQTSKDLAKWKKGKGRKRDVLLCRRCTVCARRGESNGILIKRHSKRKE